MGEKCTYSTQVADGEKNVLYRLQQRAQHDQILDQGEKSNE